MSDLSAEEPTLPAPGSFAALSVDQVAQLQAFMDVYRPFMGRLAQILNAGQRLDDNWMGGVQTSLASLTSGTVIEIRASAPGSMPLTADEVIATMADIEQALGAFNALANRQAYIKAAGLSATL